ncbi:MAG TPA: hypothetical protein VKB05_18200 [Pyrinomonadaceae bacterium]|nr:hypothetical protein [Pyrinomonadaceae bacterium]
MTSNVPFTQPAALPGLRTFGGMIYEPPSARVWRSRYEALTIMSLMGHKDLKTTMRYIRAVQLQRDVRPIQFVHKLATNEIRPPLTVAVNY